MSDLIVYVVSYLLPIVVVLVIGAPDIQITPRFALLGNPAPGRVGRVFGQLTAMNFMILIFFSLALEPPPVIVPIVSEIVYAFFARYMGPYLE